MNRRGFLLKYFTLMKYMCGMWGPGVKCVLISESVRDRPPLFCPVAEVVFGCYGDAAGLRVKMARW